jgi:putative SOS response-associated peptidase YedK
LGIEGGHAVAASYRPRFNIAPTDQHFIITSEFERRKAQSARWGLVNRWARDRSRASQCINAKAETLEQRLTFREAFQQRRCVVPGDGYYEWVPVAKGKRQPLWIHPQDGGLMLFAGLYESWFPEKNQPEVTFIHYRHLCSECSNRRNSRSHAGRAQRPDGGRLDEPARAGSAVT